MPLFHYEALDQAEQRVTGEIHAESVTDAVAELEGQGLRVQAIGPASRDRSTGEPVDAAIVDPAPSSPPVAADHQHEQDLLQGQIAQAVERGRTILPALRAYADELPRGPHRRGIARVVRALEADDLTRAMNDFNEHPDYWLALLSAVSSSSDAPGILQRFIEQSQEVYTIRNQWQRVLIYPALIASLALVMLIVISVFVTPTFRDIFETFDTELPAATQATLYIGAAIAGPWIVLVLLFPLVAAALGLAFVRLLPESVTSWFSRIRTTRTAQLANCIADLLDGGTPLPDAVRVAGIVVDRRRLRQPTADLARGLEVGAVAEISRLQRALSATLLYAVQCDLNVPARVRLLRELSRCNLERAQAPPSMLMNAVGPVALVFVGLIIGWTLLSLLMPLFMLIQSLA